MSHSVSTSAESDQVTSPLEPTTGGTFWTAFWVLGFSLLCAALYYAFDSLGLRFESQLWVIAKWLSIASLAFLAWTRLFRKGAMILGLALLMHSVGDVLIERAPLEWAIVAFALGHLIYLVLFVYVGLTPRGDRVRISTAVAVLLVGAGFLGWLLPRLGEGSAVPIVVYSAVVVAMALLSTQVRRGQPWVGLGGVSFLVSDAIIATDRFAHQLSWADAATWPLYYLGQLAITCGILWGTVKLLGSESEDPPTSGGEGEIASDAVATNPIASQSEEPPVNGEDSGSMPPLGT